MDSKYKSIHFMIGQLHITIINQWQGFHYANNKNAEGWYIDIGFISFWGNK